MRHEGFTQDQPSTSQAPPTLIPGAYKQILTRRRIDFTFLSREGFIIGEKIKRMSWGYLYSLDLPTYPSLVREFYTSIARGSRGFHCKLRGTNITVNEELLCWILKMSSNRGFGIVHFERESALKLIFNRDDVNPLEDIFAS